MEPTLSGSEAELSVVVYNLGTLFIIGSGLALLLRARRLFMSLMLLGIALIVVGHVGPSSLEGLPLYVLLGLGVLVVLSLLRAVLVLFVGRRAGDTAVGALVGNLITLLFVWLLFPVRLLRRALLRRR